MFIKVLILSILMFSCSHQSMDVNYENQTNSYKAESASGKINADELIITIEPEEPSLPRGLLEFLNKIPFYRQTLQSDFKTWGNETPSSLILDIFQSNPAVYQLYLEEKKEFKALCNTINTLVDSLRPRNILYELRFDSDSEFLEKIGNLIHSDIPTEEKSAFSALMFIYSELPLLVEKIIKIQNLLTSLGKCFDESDDLKGFKQRMQVSFSQELNIDSFNASIAQLSQKIRKEAKFHDPIFLHLDLHYSRRVRSAFGFVKGAVGKFEQLKRQLIYFKGD